MVVLECKYSCEGRNLICRSLSVADSSYLELFFRSSSTFLPDGAGALVFWNHGRRFDHNFYKSAGYFRVTWVSPEERTRLDRTMALIDLEIERSDVEFSHIFTRDL